MTTEKCSCGSSRIGIVSGRCVDMCSVELPGFQTFNGYPTIFGDGDNITVSFCLDCGKITKDCELFPMTDEVLEEEYGMRKPKTIANRLKLLMRFYYEKKLKPGPEEEEAYIYLRTYEYIEEEFEEREDWATSKIQWQITEKGKQFVESILNKVNDLFIKYPE